MISLGFTQIGRRTAVVAGIVISAVACSDEATAPERAPRVPPGISAVDNPDLIKIATIPPVVDGRIGRGEYAGAASYSFRATIPSVFNVVSTPVRVYVTHDQTYLYLAAVFDRKGAFHPMDLVGFEFDNDNDGHREDGDDVVFTRPSTPQNVLGPTFDFYRYSTSTASQTQGDNLGGGTIDAVSAWGTGGTTGVFEIRQPLNSADNAHDISINPWIFPMTVGLQTMVKLEGGEVGSGLYATTHYPSFTTYCKLMIGVGSVNMSCQ